LSKFKEYTGMLVYSIGSYDAKKKTGYNIYPGWILIKDSADIAACGSQEGKVHGNLVKSYFDMEPRALARDYGASFAGFALMKGEFKTGSWTLNTGDAFHGGKKDLSANEKSLIKGAIIEYAKAGFPAGKNTSVKDCIAADSAHGGNDLSAFLEGVKIPLECPGHVQGMYYYKCNGKCNGVK